MFSVRTKHREMEAGVESTHKTVHNSREVELTPFANQVGGHMPMFLLQPDVVAKVFSENEYNFYRHLRPDLLPFTAALKGTLDVRVEEDGDGFVRLIGAPKQSDCNESSVDPADNCSAGKRLRLRRSGSVVTQRATGNGSQCCTRATSHNEKKRIAELLNGSVKTIRFMLLENLLAGHERSCILDLKVGTRQYPDGASEMKKERHIRRVMESTSSSLGIRCCGMRAYRDDLNGYLQQDKYVGRTLTEEELVQTFRLFLYGPHGLRRQILLDFLKQARDLRTALQLCDSYRFYCASLLLVFSAECDIVEVHEDKTKGVELVDYVIRDVHPGSQTTQADGPRVRGSSARLKLIDFANSTYHGMEGSVRSHIGPDRGCIKGVISLERILQQLLDEEERAPSLDSLQRYLRQS